MSVFKDDSRRELKRWKDVIESHKCIEDKFFYAMLPHPITIEMTRNREHVSFIVNCVMQDRKTGRMYWGEAVNNGTDYPAFKWYDYDGSAYDIQELFVTYKHEPLTAYGGTGLFPDNE